MPGLKAQYRRPKRPVHGILLLDKPMGMTSNAALQAARRLLEAEKGGHTGNLDPLATGLLPLCFGEATKFSQYGLDADKVYCAEISLGVTTETGDAEGAVLERRPVPALQSAAIEQVLAGFLGPIEQVPPMHSALKHQGRALYTYARAGQSIERAPRPVIIHRLHLDALSGDRITVTVACSKGTYVRVLAEDIGARIGCGAHLTALRRLATGGLTIGSAVTLAAFEAMDMAGREACLQPSDLLVSELGDVHLDADSAHYLRHGQPVWLPKQGARRGMLRLYDHAGTFLGLGEVSDDGRIAPRRLVRF